MKLFSETLCTLLGLWTLAFPRRLAATKHGVRPRQQKQFCWLRLPTVSRSHIHMPPERVPDPTLPPGWEALYDTTSGSKYYWNPTTNAVTYDRPTGGPPPPSPRCTRRAACVVGAKPSGWLEF